MDQRTRAVVAVREEIPTQLPPGDVIKALGLRWAEHTSSHVRVDAHQPTNRKPPIVNSLTRSSPSEAVVVVGAGPTGLWLAAELATAGVRAVVLEKRTERSPYARALGIMPRTLEVLALRGAAEPFLDAGHPVPAWHFGLLEESVRFDTLETAFPHMLLLPQTTTETLLEERARRLGVEIITAANVVGLSQDDAAATATVTYEHDGTTQTVDAALVVGCDGGRSAVRELAGIALDGEPSSAWGFVGDVFLKAPPAPGTRFVRPDGALIIAPLPGGRSRLTGWDPKHQRPDEQLDLDTLRGFAHQMAGTDFGAEDPSWLSRFGNANGLAATFRKGRVLLAGDAAHIHWPTGGLGLNAGIQDAMSLGWRAAAVVRGSMPDTALDDYASERRAYGQELRTSTLTQSALITAADPATLAIRATLNRVLATREGNRTIGNWLAGLTRESTLPAVRVLRTDPKRSHGASDDVRALFADGKPVLTVTDPDLHAAVQEGLAVVSDAITVALVEPSSTEAPVVSRAMLFRPDGVASWTSDDDGPIAAGLNTALRALGVIR